MPKLISKGEKTSHHEMSRPHEAPATSANLNTSKTMNASVKTLTPDEAVAVADEFEDILNDLS